MSAPHFAMNTAQSNRPFTLHRAIARARYHGYSRAFVASQPPFVLLDNGPKVPVNEDFWAQLLARPHTQAAADR